MLTLLDIVVVGSQYLLVHNSAETSLALDDGVRHAHLPAQCGKEDDKLDGIDIIRDEHQRCLLRLDESNNVVETILDSVWLLADILLLLALRNGRSLLVQPLLLLLLRLRSVLREQLEDLRCGVAVEGVRELRNRRGHFEAHVEYLALALQAYVFGPFHHAREVALRLDVLADTEVAGLTFDEGILELSTHTLRSHWVDGGSSPCWHSSCSSHRPCRQGMAPERSSCQILEAVIEKNSQSLFVPYRVCSSHEGKCNSSSHVITSSSAERNSGIQVIAAACSLCRAQVEQWHTTKSSVVIVYAYHFQ
jgi:hypothetical protein